VPTEATTQLSYSGTPRLSPNVTQPDEYVRDLQDPVKRMEIFDEMRSSDEAINTAISAREQMIGSSNWLLSCAGDTPAEKEILEFCEDNVYPVLNQLLRHLSGAIQYGFGAARKYSSTPIAPSLATSSAARSGARPRTAGADLSPQSRAHQTADDLQLHSPAHRVISSSSASSCTRGRDSRRPIFPQTRFCSGHSIGAVTTTGDTRRLAAATARGSSSSSSRS
jgi:hypothetical protein